MLKKIKEEINNLHPRIEITSYGIRWEISLKLEWMGLTAIGRDVCLTKGIGTLPSEEQYASAIEEAKRQARQILFWQFVEFKNLIATTPEED